MGKLASPPECGAWFCWGSVPVSFSSSPIFSSHFHRLWFGGLWCQVRCNFGTCLWGIIGSCVTGPVWVLRHVLPWNALHLYGTGASCRFLRNAFQCVSSRRLTMGKFWFPHSPIIIVCIVVYRSSLFARCVADGSCGVTYTYST
jgi:hypothetical protein